MYLKESKSFRERTSEAAVKFRSSINWPKSAQPDANITNILWLCDLDYFILIKLDSLYGSDCASAVFIVFYVLARCQMLSMSAPTLRMEWMGGW
jgi:hypothetical protein